jgi:hypothetical protein
MQLESCNNMSQPKYFYEQASDLYNDPNCNPTTNLYTDLHDDFSIPIILLSSNAPKVLSLIKKLKDVRSKLVLVNDNWVSGNGNGMESLCTFEDPTFGQCETNLIDDNRANFSMDINLICYIFGKYLMILKFCNQFYVYYQKR